jgi:hypothetical protein
MSRCYHCGKILSDAWVKKQGAALMGKASGESKRRSTASKAARQRWLKRDYEKLCAEIAAEAAQIGKQK